LLGACSQGAPTPGSLLAFLWPALEQEFLIASRDTTGSPSAAPEPVVGEHAAPPLRRLPAAWASPALPQPPAVLRLPVAAQAAREAREYDWVGLTGRAVGTVVHAELQRLAAAPDETLDEAALAPAAGYAAWLRALSVPATELPAAVQRVFAALQGTLDDPRGRWLLSNANPRSRSEWRLTGMHAGRVVNVIIDRLLVDEQGQHWIVDFKTSAHEGGGMDTFIAAEMQRYRSQLERYAALAAPLVGGAIRLALYFPLLGVFRELPA
jgi:ATP-dependent exoDNAse (exonuclease V) beta subunit